MIKENSIIAAIKDEESLEKALLSPAQVIFLLKANICTLRKTIQKCHDYNKIVYIHMEMIEGFGKDEASVKYIGDHFKADGIITTKSSIVGYAKKYNLDAVFRVFIVDTQSIETAISNINKCKAKYVEVMPGIVPAFIGMLSAKTNASFIAGGLISNQKHIDRAFKGGAIACSTSNEELWNEI